MGKIDIMEATVVKYIGIYGDNAIREINSDKFSVRKLDLTVIKTINCVIDFERHNAIDLETGRIYHIIERNEHGHVLSTEIDKLEKDRIAVVFYMRKDLSNMSTIYKLFLQDRARKRYKQYLDDIKLFDEPPKVKKIGTINQNNKEK